MRKSFLTLLIVIMFGCQPEQETPQYSLKTSSNPTNGGTIVPSSGQYYEGEIVEIKAEANTDYVFHSWSGSVSGSSNTISVEMNSDKDIEANFYNEKYDLTLDVFGEGEVTSKLIVPDSFSTDVIVELTATPTGEWEFVEWSGDITSTENPVEVNFDSPKNITATFTRSFDYTQPSYYHFKADFRFEPSEIARSLGNYNENDGYITSVAYADFNLDGYIDVAYAKGNNTISLHPVEIYLNSGDNKNFTYDKNYIQNNVGTEGVRKSIIGDFNGDKKPDVFFADHGAEPAGATQYYGAMQSILLSNNDGYQLNVVNEIPKEFNHSACSGDFDNDGDLDIFTATGHFLINDGNANFTLNEDIFESDVVGIFTTEMIDINNDGFLDLFVAGHSFEDWDLEGPMIFYGNGSNFSDTNSIVLDDLTSWGVVTDIDFVDFNNDGFLEILLNRTGGLKDDWSYFYRGWRIQIFENNAGDEFIDETQKYIDDFQERDGRWTVWYRIQDIDGDGQLELFDDDPTHNGNGIDLFWDWNGSMFIKK